jgi:hypothetical protein
MKIKIMRAEPVLSQEQNATTKPLNQHNNEEEFQGVDISLTIRNIKDLINIAKDISFSFESRSYFINKTSQVTTLLYQPSLYQ